MNETEKPLVTFALFAYNQERFIREAVEGAFAQTYSPLQIILSDDCSSDRTFEIMQEMSSLYTGPHQIFLNRNYKNKGIGGHVNEVMKIASGELIVVAAGDDVSFAHRTEVLAKKWISSGRSFKSLHSYAEEINVDGVITGKILANGHKKSIEVPLEHANLNLCVLGATHAWDREVFEVFGDILDKVMNEDVVIPFRSSIIGKITFIPEALVQYRLGVGVSHEVVNNRNVGIFNVPRSNYLRAYINFVQKFKDAKKGQVLHTLQYEIKRSRAETLLPYMLRSQYNLTKSQRCFFYCRCRKILLAREFIKYKFPALVKAKQLLQFEIINKTNGFISSIKQKL